MTLNRLQSRLGRNMPLQIEEMLRRAPIATHQVVPAHTTELSSCSLCSRVPLRCPATATKTTAKARIAHLQRKKVRTFNCAIFMRSLIVLF